MTANPSQPVKIKSVKIPPKGIVSVGCRIFENHGKTNIYLMVENNDPNSESSKAAVTREPNSKQLYRPCPKCRSMMIENKKYIECGEMYCNYVESIKP